jgi:hypothetical protein
VNRTMYGVMPKSPKVDFKKVSKVKVLSKVKLLSNLKKLFKIMVLSNKGVYFTGQPNQSH